jgi:hypothetical protein
MMPGLRKKLPILLALAGAFALLLLIVAARARYRQSGALFVSDGFGYYIYLPSLIIDGDLDLSNQLAHQAEQPDQQWYRVSPTTGRPGNAFQVGCALLWSPFFLAAHLVVTALTALGFHPPRDGFGFAYELPVYCGSFCYGLLGLYFIHRLLKQLWGSPVATAATLYIALASPVAAYLWFEPDMSHGLSMALIAALFYYLERARQAGDRRWATWAGLGALTGLTAAVRVPDGLVVIAVVWVALSVIGPNKASAARASAAEILCCSAAFVAAAGLAFLPQLLVWKALYGSYLLIPKNTTYERMHWLQPDILGYLFSSRRGIFVWTPVLLPAAVGLVAGLRKGPPILRYSLLVLAAALYFNSSLPAWWLGCSFSERRMVDYAVVFALGLGYLLSLRPAWIARPALHAAGIALCLFNWVLMVRYFTHDLPEDARIGEVSFSNLLLGTMGFPFRHLAKYLGMLTFFG